MKPANLINRATQGQHKERERTSLSFLKQANTKTNTNASKNKNKKKQTENRFNQHFDEQVNITKKNTTTDRSKIYSKHSDKPVNTKANASRNRSAQRQTLTTLQKIKQESVTMKQVTFKDNHLKQGKQGQTLRQTGQIT